MGATYKNGKKAKKEEEKKKKKKDTQQFFIWFLLQFISNLKFNQII